MRAWLVTNWIEEELPPDELTGRREIMRYPNLFGITDRGFAVAAERPDQCLVVVVGNHEMLGRLREAAGVGWVGIKGDAGVNTSLRISAINLGARQEWRSEDYYVKEGPAVAASSIERER